MLFRSDGDAAGMKASLRGINMLLEEGFGVKVVTFPEGEDPDSYSRQVSGGEFREYLKESAKDFLEADFTRLHDPFLMNGM